MSDPLSRPRAMSNDQVQQILDAIKSKGGSITYQDPRLSSFIGWAAVVIGALAVASITWGVSTMQELNLKVGILITQHENDNRRNDIQDGDIKELARQVRALESRHDARN